VFTVLVVFVMPVMLVVSVGPAYHTELFGLVEHIGKQFRSFDSFGEIGLKRKKIQST
jgi:hypothetical protein